MEPRPPERLPSLCWDYRHVRPSLPLTTVFPAAGTCGCLGLWEPHGCSSGFPRVPSSPPPCGDAGVPKLSSLPKWPQSGSLDPAHCIKGGALNPCVTSTRGVPLIRCLGRRLGRDSWKGDLGLGPNSSCVVVGVFSKWRSLVGSPAVHHLTRCSRRSL